MSKQLMDYDTEYFFTELETKLEDLLKFIRLSKLKFQVSYENKDKDDNDRPKATKEEVRFHEMHNDSIPIVNSNKQSLHPNKNQLVQSMIQETVYPPKIDFKNPMNVSFSYVCSTRNFFVHLDYPKLEQYYIQLNDFYRETNLKELQLKPSDIYVNGLYVLYYSSDESYLRVRLLEIIDDENVKVFYVDYGEIQSAPKKDLLQLVPEFENVPFFALKCFINDQWKSDFQKLDSAILEFIENNDSFYQEIKATFSKPIYDRYPISISIKNCNQDWKEFTLSDFNVEIFEYFVDSHFDCVKYVLDSSLNFDKDLISNAYKKLELIFSFSSCIRIYKALVTKVIDISNFLVTSNNLDNYEVNNFVTNMSYFYFDSPELITNKIKINDVVVIKHNNFFFRAFVLDQKLDGYEIFAFDIGFVSIVKKFNIYHLVDIFSLENYTPLSIMCALDNILPFRENWSLLVINQFKNICKQPLHINVKSFKNGKFQVDLLFNDSDVATMFKRLRFAKDACE